MKLKFVEINLNRTKPKATIHQSGKLGFNNEASTCMNLQAQKTYKLATDEDGDNLYLLEANEESGTAKIAKAGQYYYLNVGDAFDALGIDYKNNTVIFDIKKEDYEGKEIFVLQKRIIPRNKE